MKKNIEWVEIVRGIACLMVILLHLTANYIYALPPESNKWHLFNLIDSLTRSCVPLFFMISGYIFIIITDITFKHFLRIALCIFFYSLICAIFLFGYNDISILSSLKKAFFTPIIYHLWFFYALIPCYFFFLLFSNKNKGEESINILVILIVITSVFFVFSYSGNDQIKIFELTNPIVYKLNSEVCYYIFYAIIGSILGSKNTIAIRNKHLGLIFLISLISIFTGTQYLSEKKGWLDSTYYLYNTLPVALCSICVFLLLKNNSEKINIKIKNIIKWIAKVSLPAYGIHATFVVYFRDIKLLNNIGFDYILKISLTLLGTFILSYVIKRLDVKSWIS